MSIYDLDLMKEINFTVLAGIAFLLNFFFFFIYNHIKFEMKKKKKWKRIEFEKKCEIDEDY